MRVLSTWCAVVLFAVVGCASSGNASGQDEQHGEAHASRWREGRRGDAIKTALDKAPGRVVDTELRSKDGKAVWEIDIASSDGKLTEVDVDANTGLIADSE